MKPLVLPGLLLIATLALFFLSGRTRPKATDRGPTLFSPSPEEILSSPSVETPMLGEEILAAYATPGQSPQQDLQDLQNLLATAFTLIKRTDSRSYATNRDLVLFLQGQNKGKEQFLPQSGIPHVINSDGQLIDRWQTPLQLHLLSEQDLELRSAGPDQKLWTADDLTNGSKLSEKFLDQ